MAASHDKASRSRTSFTVPGKGTRYQWTVTPMGLQGSPASFVRLIDYVFRGITGVITYITAGGTRNSSKSWNKHCSG